MLKRIVLLFCALYLGSTAVLFSVGEQEQNVLDNRRNVSVVIVHCTS